MPEERGRQTGPGLLGEVDQMRQSVITRAVLLKNVSTTPGFVLSGFSGEQPVQVLLIIASRSGAFGEPTLDGEPFQRRLMDFFQMVRQLVATDVDLELAAHDVLLAASKRIDDRHLVESVLKAFPTDDIGWKATIKDAVHRQSRAHVDLVEERHGRTTLDGEPERPPQAVTLLPERPPQAVTLLLRADDLEKTGGKVRAYIETADRPVQKGGLTRKWVELLRRFERSEVIETRDREDPVHDRLRRLATRADAEGWGVTIRADGTRWTSTPLKILEIRNRSEELAEDLRKHGLEPS